MNYAFIPYRPIVWLYSINLFIITPPQIVIPICASDSTIDHILRHTSLILSHNHPKRTIRRAEMSPVAAETVTLHKRQCLRSYPIRIIQTDIRRNGLSANVQQREPLRPMLRTKISITFKNEPMTERHTIVHYPLILPTLIQTHIERKVHSSSFDEFRLQYSPVSQDMISPHVLPHILHQLFFICIEVAIDETSHPFFTQTSIEQADYPTVKRTSRIINRIPKKLLNRQLTTLKTLWIKIIYTFHIHMIL